AEVWRLSHALGEGDRSGLDRLEPEAALVVGAGAAEAGESGIERQVPPVAGMTVAAVRVRLPDLDQRVRDRRAVAVEDAALDPDALTLHPVAGQDVERVAEQRVLEERPDGLGRGHSPARRRHRPASLGAS